MCSIKFTRISYYRNLVFVLMSNIASRQVHHIKFVFVLTVFLGNVLDIGNYPLIPIDIN